jgi:hypothetical protein
MNINKLIAGSAVAGGLGLAALGVGPGVAQADPPPGPGPVEVHQRPEIPWQDRDGYDRAVRDHRPFQYQGRWVTPVFDPGYRAWGFWLGPLWIPLI